MARSKLIAILLLIALTAIQAFTPFQHWYSPYLAASLIILLTAVLQKTGSNNDN